MTLLTSVAGWTAFGFLARAFANGIECRPPLHAPQRFVPAMVIFGAFGYWIHGVQERQEAELNKRLAAIIEKRKHKEVQNQLLQQQ